MAVISSTAARSALEQGDVEAAARRLGRFYAVSGIVIPGQKLGRTLGVPTANVALEPTNRLKPDNENQDCQNQSTKRP